MLRMATSLPGEYLRTSVTYCFPNPPSYDDPVAGRREFIEWKKPCPQSFALGDSASCWTKPICRPARGSSTSARHCALARALRLERALLMRMNPLCSTASNAFFSSCAVCTPRKMMQRHQRRRMRPTCALTHYWVTMMPARHTCRTNSAVPPRRPASDRVAVGSSPSEKTVDGRTAPTSGFIGKLCMQFARELAL